MDYRHPEKIVDSLRAQGYRITKAREDIITILCNVKHYTVDELVHELKKTKDNVNVATVYNNINFLVDEGIVLEFNFNNKNTTYELNIGIHAHFVCVDCGYVTNVDVPEFDVIQQRVEQEIGCEITNTKLDMFGHCSTCLAQHQTPPEDDSFKLENIGLE